MLIWEITGPRPKRPTKPKRTAAPKKKRKPVLGKTAWEKNYAALKSRKRELKPRSPIKPVRMIG